MVGICQNRLGKAILTNIHDVCFHGEKKKGNTISELASTSPVFYTSDLEIA